MSKPKISSGNLDTRITIALAPVISKSPTSNEVIEVPGANITVWAMRESNINSQVDEGDFGLTLSQQKLVYYIIRYRENIGAKCTVTDSFGTYNIEAVDILGRKQLLKLRCELITQDNV